MMKERLVSINPDLHISACHEFVVPELADELLARHTQCTFVVDCIDSVEPKVHLIGAALQRGVRVVSAMGAGGKVDPSQVQVGWFAPSIAPLRLLITRRHAV